jgi:hypothetical protein
MNRYYVITDGPLKQYLTAGGTHVSSLHCYPFDTVKNLVEMTYEARLRQAVRDLYRDDPYAQDLVRLQRMSTQIVVDYDVMKRHMLDINYPTEKAKFELPQW